MRKTRLMVILAIVFALIITYQIINYNQVKAFNELVLNRRIVDNISIYKGQNGSPSLVISNQIEIKEILEKLYDIKLKRLSKEEDVSFMVNGDRMLRDDLLSIQFYNSEKIGQLLIWSDGSIYIVDIRSMVSSKRTETYKSEVAHPEIYTILKQKVD